MHVLTWFAIANIHTTISLQNSRRCICLGCRCTSLYLPENFLFSLLKGPDLELDILAHTMNNNVCFTYFIMNILVKDKFLSECLIKLYLLYLTSRIRRGSPSDLLSNLSFIFTSRKNISHIMSYMRISLHIWLLKLQNSFSVVNILKKMERSRS